jgi:hypothetical protein
MSSAEEEADEVCANCGKAAVDNIILKICTACKLVKYCSVECQKNHRRQHKSKNRAAEIRDDKLFRQPDYTHLGECPICCLPLPLDAKKWAVNSCCCKRICLGCSYANQLRELEQGLEQRCPYCRDPLPVTKKESQKNVTKRAKANDPIALCQLGESATMKGTLKEHLNISQMRLDLGIWTHTTIYQFCTVRGKVLRKI